MKIIGLLGGTSWPSTPLYYNYINKKVAQALGGHHSARIILYSINYDPIKSRYTADGGWDEIPAILRDELKRLDDMGPDYILICNNTLHKGFDILVEQQEAVLQAQVVHLVVATAKKAQEIEAKRVLLLGTKFTMEDGFFADRLSFFGLDVSVPSEEDRNEIQDMQSQISAGIMKDEFAERFRKLLSRYGDVDAVILGCTELPMVINEGVTDLPIIDTIHAQCDEVIKQVVASYHREEEKRKAEELEAQEEAAAE